MDKRLLSAVLLIGQTLACDYVPPSDEDIMVGNTEYLHRQGTNSEPLWDWIRIVIEYDESVNNSCLSRGIPLPNGTTVCLFDCVKKCGYATAPKSADYFSECACASSKFRNWFGTWTHNWTGSWTDILERTKCVSWSEQTSGGKLDNADFVVFVSVLKEICNNRTLANAMHCVIDPTTKRPIAGQINVCPDTLDISAHNKLLQLEFTVKHELTHALVFSPTLFKDFPGAGQYKREKDLFVIPNVVERFTRLDWETSTGVMKHDVYMMVTPRVREEARRHFNCSTLEGAELENYDSIGTAGAHWEKRIFELLTSKCWEKYVSDRVHSNNWLFAIDRHGHKNFTIESDCF